MGDSYVEDSCYRLTGLGGECEASRFLALRKIELSVEIRLLDVGM